MSEKTHCGAHQIVCISFPSSLAFLTLAHSSSNKAPICHRQISRPLLRYVTQELRRTFDCSMNDQQSYLSKFFKPLPSPSSQPQRTPIVIDGSESEDEVQPIASTSKRPRSPNSPGRVSVNKKHKVTGNLASWYFDAQDTEPKSPKPSETQKRLRGKFLGNLSQKTSGYLDKDSRYTPQSRQRKTSSELNEVQKLRRAKVTYTPLEEQWLNFKEANVCNSSLAFLASITKSTSATLPARHAAHSAVRLQVSVLWRRCHHRFSIAQRCSHQGKTSDVGHDS